MKKILSIIALTLLIISCNETKPKLTAKEIAKKNIENSLKNSLHDAGSYEFVSLSDIDTVFTKEHYASVLEKTQDLKESILRGEQSARRFDTIAIESRRLGKAGEENAIEAELEAAKIRKSNLSSQKVIDKYQEKHDQAKDSDIMEMTTILKYRAKNGMGAMRLGESRYYLNDTLGVIKSQKID